MADRLAWGILATGRIAKTFAHGVKHSKTGTLVAVGSRSQKGADEFGKEFGLSRCHGSYEALLADPEVQAVYISTPHPMHAEWAIKAAEAGKHILCEKPIGLNHAEAMAIVEAAARNDVFLMEAFMYRCHPLIAKLVELLQEKAIGEVTMIQASFGFRAGFNPEGRLWKNELGGGGIMDVGCYPVSMARLVAGVAAGKPFLDPLDVKASGTIHPQTGVDCHTAALLKFESGVVAQVATSIDSGLDNVVRIHGTEGRIELPSAWIPVREGGAAKIVLHRKGEAQDIEVKTGEWLYGIEADTVARHLEKRQAPSPAMSWDDTLGNMQTLDAWREQLGVVYAQEKPENSKLTLRGTKLAVRPKHNMKYGMVPGVDKKVSRTVIGCDNQRTFSHGATMWDDFFEQGGNCFDTAWVYGRGLPEKLLGQWIRQRGIREQVVLISKGAHTPWCNPKDMEQHMADSLERLQVDYVDIYFMHRDNLDIPVGEFADLLNRWVQQGKVKAFGGSNWTTQRIDELNAYAEKKGQARMTAVSNNFSLARMVDPVWKGCIAASAPEFRAWLTKNNFALMPWSSQARGFFTERAGKDKTDDAELVRCWYSDDNFQRRDRALELAKKRNCLAIQIALAYVLCQPFPTFPLIGPRLLSETRTSLPALDIELTPAELKWLNLED